MPTGNPFKPVATGDKARLNRDWYNAVSATTQAQKQQRVGNSADPRAIDVPEGMVYVRNDSGADVPRFSVLGISGVVFTPTVNNLEFQNKAAVTGVTPTTASHTGIFVVTWTPIAKNAIGKAFAFGACAVQINVVSSGDKFADVKNGDRTQLQSGASGTAQILWKESGAGTRWALIRFGGAGSAGSNNLVSLTMVSGSAGVSPANWRYNVTDIVSGASLASNVSPSFRDAGPRDQASFGLAYTAGGVTTLIHAFEKLHAGSDYMPLQWQGGLLVNDWIRAHS